MFTQDKRNLIIAVAAIFVILLAWQFLMPVLFPPDERPRAVVQQTTTDGVPADQVTVTQPSDAVDAPGAGVAEGTPSIGDEATRQALAESPRLMIDSARLAGSISLVGGRFDAITLKDYRETADEESPEIELLAPRDSERPYFVDFGWVSGADSVSLPESGTLWTADREVLTTEKPVTLTWNNGAGLAFTRRIAVDDQFAFSVTQEVRNTSAAPIELAPFARIARFTVPSSTLFKPLWIFEDGALGVLGEDYVEGDYEDLQDAFWARQDNPNLPPQFRHDVTSGWMGITDKYWLVALIPEQQKRFVGSFEYVPIELGKVDSYQTIFQGEKATLNPGQTISVTNHLFTGAKEISALDHYEQTLGADRFDLAVDFGPAWFLSKPMFHAIDFFNRMTGNFGVAILLLTICVRIVLFPLANKAYASMSRMRKVQPEMIRLRERYKDDKQKMNTELMALYKREKANPIAGCLPLLVQLPVFFALYYMLFVTIEMRHAPFFGWIQDLSAPDPLTFITAFGFLEWPAPDFLLIGIWPIAFGFTMWLQMKLNPQPMEPIQQKILMALPIVFLFLFARFPAGLVVYWTWNNVLSIGQQWLIMRRMGITRESLAADAEKIKKIKEQAEKGLLAKPSQSRRRKSAGGTTRSKTSDGTAQQSRKRARPSKAKEKAARDDNATPRQKRQTLRDQAEARQRQRQRQKRERARAKEREKRKKSADTEPPAPPKKSRRERRAERAAAREGNGGAGGNAGAASGRGNGADGESPADADSGNAEPLAAPRPRRPRSKKPTQPRR